MCCNIRYHDPVVDWLAHLESSLRKSGSWSGSNSGLHSSLHYNVQYHGQVPLDESHRKGQVYTIMLAILLVPEEAPWSGQGSPGAGWEAAPHMSMGLGQTASLEPVIEAVVDVGVRALAGIEADSAKLPMKPPGYSVSLTRPGVLFTSSRMLVDFLFKLICSFFLFARVL